MDLDESGLSSEEAFGWWEENETEAGLRTSAVSHGGFSSLGTSSNHAGGCSIAMSGYECLGGMEEERENLLVIFTVVVKCPILGILDITL